MLDVLKEIDIEIELIETLGDSHQRMFVPSILDGFVLVLLVLDLDSGLNSYLICATDVAPE